MGVSISFIITFSGWHVKFVLLDWEAVNPRCDSLYIDTDVRIFLIQWGVGTSQAVGEWWTRNTDIFPLLSFGPSLCGGKFLNSDLLGGILVSLSV